MKRFLAIMLATMLVLCSSLTAFAEDADSNTNQPPQMGDGAPEGTPPEMPEGGFPGGPGMGTPPEMPEGGFPGGPGGPGGTPPEKPDGQPGVPGGSRGGMSESEVAGTGNQVNTEGLVDITDGTVTSNNSWSESIQKTDGAVILDGIVFESGNYSDTLLSVSSSNVMLKDAGIVMNVDDAITGNEAAGTAAYVDSGMLTVSGSDITVSGAGRYTVAATGTATMVVENSVIAAGGDTGTNGNTASVNAPASNAGLLISGNSRANFSVGQTHTFYYDSLCAADGWAALSTDSATGSGLEFVGVNTEALALHGGYGIYADTNCRDYLYGCTLVSAEVGGIISNNGTITTGSTADAESAVTKDGNSAMAYSANDTDADTRTVIIAGRSDFQLHSPDMMGEGNSDYSAALSLSHTDLVTDDSINGSGYEYISSINGKTYVILATEDYGEKYGDAIGAYIDYISGASILVKSTSADIKLDDVTVDSSSGVALLTTLNSDSMSRYLKQDVGRGVNVTITDSAIAGNFVHNDYQRDLNIVLDNSTLNGGVTCSDAEEWNDMWSDYSDDESACWVNLDANTYITGPHETCLSLENGSVWNVQADSTLTTLTVSADSTVNGVIRAEETKPLDDGNMVYTNVTVSAI